MHIGGCIWVPIAAANKNICREFSCENFYKDWFHFFVFIYIKIRSKFYILYHFWCKVKHFHRLNLWAEFMAELASLSLDIVIPSIWKLIGQLAKKVSSSSKWNCSEFMFMCNNARSLFCYSSKTVSQTQ